MLKNLHQSFAGAFGDEDEIGHEVRTRMNTRAFTYILFTGNVFVPIYLSDNSDSTSRQ